MGLKNNGIYSTNENKIIIILSYYEDTNDILYLEIDEEFEHNSNKEVNEYFYRKLKQTGAKGFCKYCKRKSRNDVEKLIDGFLGQLAHRSETDNNSIKEVLDLIDKNPLPM